MYKLNKEGKQMAKFVYFTAKGGSIDVSIDQNYIGSASTAQQMQALLEDNNVTLDDTLAHSSSIDFAEEEGFATDDCAHAIIDAALEQL